MGLGDEFSPDFKDALRGLHVSDVDFRHIVESLVEIVFASFYGASQNEQSLDFLHRVIAATAPFGISPPPPALFSVSLFADNNGWGKPLSKAERDQWRTANYRQPRDNNTLHAEPPAPRFLETMISTAAR